MTQSPASLKRRVLIINTLGGALHHYTHELVDNLSDPGNDITVATIFEPSQAGGGRLGWILRYVRIVLSARRLAKAAPNPVVIVTWPVLGYLDFLLLVVLGRRTDVKLVVHDPLPLVTAIGYDQVSRTLARMTLRNRQIIVHSTAALTDVQDQGFGAIVVQLPHPILEAAIDGPAPSDRPRVVRVLGQFKPDRDVTALEQVSASIDSAVTLEIRGRRWPQVRGWNVVEGFVPEEELQHLLSSSDAVIVPYTRFYQSGIAIRCLEYGVPIVGPAGTSLEDLLGAGSPLLVQATESGVGSGGWASAVATGLTTTRGDIQLLVAALRNDSRERWKACLTDDRR